MDRISSASLLAAGSRDIAAGARPGPSCASAKTTSYSPERGPVEHCLECSSIASGPSSRLAAAIAASTLAAKYDFTFIIRLLPDHSHRNDLHASRNLAVRKHRDIRHRA